ncbi:MAG: hypothetical protein NXI01_01365 [Gammaproteobacteria bacterium]|nr:hypothetical protein [Gammaproteobacteria bacterium]
MNCQFDELYHPRRDIDCTERSQKAYQELIRDYGVSETVVSNFRFAVFHILLRSYISIQRSNVYIELRDVLGTVPENLLALMKNAESDVEKKTEVTRLGHQFYDFCNKKLPSYYYDNNELSLLIRLKRAFAVLYTAPVSLKNVVPFDISDEAITKTFDENCLVLIGHFYFSASEGVVSEFKSVVTEILLHMYHIDYISDELLQIWKAKFEKVPESIFALMAGERSVTDKEVEIARQVEDFCALYDAYLPSFYTKNQNHPTIARLKSALTALYDAVKYEIETSDSYGKNGVPRFKA